MYILTQMRDELLMVTPPSVGTLASLTWRRTRRGAEMKQSTTGTRCARPNERSNMLRRGSRIVEVAVLLSLVTAGVTVSAAGASAVAPRAVSLNGPYGLTLNSKGDVFVA